MDDRYSILKMKKLFSKIWNFIKLEVENMKMDFCLIGTKKVLILMAK